MTAAEAYYLPPELEPLMPGGEELVVRGERCRFPRLGPADLARVTASLVEHGARAQPGLTTARLVDTLGELAETWLDQGDPYRQAAEHLLPALTGYAPAMVAEALDRLFESLLTGGLDDLLKAEVGYLHSRPPHLLFIIPAGTVFPPAIVGATCALLLRSPVLIKPASGEPILAALWARSLAARDPELARLVAVLPWPRSRPELTAAALAAADTALVHGGDETVAAIEAAAPPTTRLIAHGHKVSAAILGARALAADAEGLARSLAADVALYDQQGCLSPHTVFVEESKALPAQRFAELLGAELEALERRWPRAPLDRATASSLRQFLAARELRSAAARARGTVLGGFEAGWAVVVEPEPGFEFSPLARTVIVKPVEKLASAVDAFGPVRGRVQAVGLAVSHADRLALARQLGLYEDVESNLDWAPRVRLCPIGTMQSPPLTWAADGHRPLASLCPRLPGAGAAED